MENNNVQTSQYVHEGDEDYERLLTLNKLVNQRYLEFLRLNSGMKILNVGSGPAILATEMANEMNGNGKIYCIERDDKVCEKAEELITKNNLSDNIVIRKGDVVDNFPLNEDEWGTFDLAEARFLLEHVHDPQRVIEQMVQSVRPGGRVILCDDDHSSFRLYPENEDVSKLLNELSKVYLQAGNDPFVGQKIAHYLNNAGATPVRSSMIHFGGVGGSSRLNEIITLTTELILNSKSIILQYTDYDEQSLDNTIEIFHEWSRKKGNALWYSIPIIEGIREI